MADEQEPKTDVERFMARLAGLEEETPAQRAKRKSIATRCRHVKRRLLQKESLKGDLLELALGNVGMTPAIEEKLEAGQPLDATSSPSCSTCICPTRD